MFSGAIFAHFGATGAQNYRFRAKNPPFGADCPVFSSSGAIFAHFGAAWPSNHRFRAKYPDFGAGRGI